MESGFFLTPILVGKENDLKHWEDSLQAGCRVWSRGTGGKTISYTHVSGKAARRYYFNANFFFSVNKIVCNFQFITIIFLASVFFMLETDEISKINNIIYYLSFICQYYLKLSGYSFLNWSTGRNRFYSLQWWSEQINLPSLHQPLRPKWIHAGTSSCWRNHSGLWQVFITVSNWKWLWVILSKCLEMLNSTNLRGYHVLRE